jgi:hypothetical protein
MDFSGSEVKDAILSHTMIGLAREDLIAKDYAHGNEEYIKLVANSSPDLSHSLSRQKLFNVTEGGVLFQPSTFGMELYHWAHGKPDLMYSDFIDPEIVFPIEPDVIIPNGSILVQ